MNIKQDVRIERDSFTRGRKKVIVDGIRWGTIDMTSHGNYGNKFHFVGCYREIPSTIKPGTFRSVLVEVEGNKMARRTADRARKPGAPYIPVLPVEERLVIEARKLIAEGILKHPDQVKRDEEKAEKELNARYEREKAKIDSEFRKRAWECITSAGHDAKFSPDEQIAVVDQIVLAMKWAQSK